MPKALLTQNARRRNVLTRVDACFKASQSVRIWVIMCIGLLLDACKRTIPLSVLNNFDFDAMLRLVTCLLLVCFDVPQLTAPGLIVYRPKHCHRLCSDIGLVCTVTA